MASVLEVGAKIEFRRSHKGNVMTAFADGKMLGYVREIRPADGAGLGKAMVEVYLQNVSIVDES